MSEGEQLERRDVVTAFLRHAGKILLVRRSTEVGTYQGHWAAISGYLEDPTPLQQARREVREETSLSDADLRLSGVGPELLVPAPELKRCWVVHPFLFDITDPERIRLDWENTELRWVAPEAIRDYPTVPKLAEALDSCLEAERAGRA